MHDDFFRYKSRFITFTLLLGYTFLHIKLTGLYVETTFAKMVDFTVIFPFAQRVLVPALVHVMGYFIPLSNEHLFFFLEWLFVGLFYYSLRQLLQEEFSLRQATLLSWLFILLLPLITVVNYRYTVNSAAGYFFPGDTPALFFMALGFLLCLRSQWYLFIPLIFLATLNRESSILILLLIPALHLQKGYAIVKPLFFATMAYCLARLIILFVLKDVPGPVFELMFGKGPFSHFELNMAWLFGGENFLFFTFCFAGIPLFWFAFYDYIPKRYRPLRYIALFYFLVLFVVGNFREARFFSEISLLLYLPVCVALRHWLSDDSIYPQNTTVAAYIDRYAVITILIMVLVFHRAINQCIIGLWHLL